MNMDAHKLASLYHRAHNLMRNVDGLQPQEAFDELLKYLFFKQINEEHGPTIDTPFQLVANESSAEIDNHTIRSIRTLFKKYLGLVNSWSTYIWQDKKIHLSDAALSTIHQLLYGLEFDKISFDIRSAALREFLPVEIRRGLGIYLTPDEVARMMVAVVNPTAGQKVYDPACGSGTFLIEVLKRWKGSRKRAVWGTDKNPRMLLLADLNIGHLGQVEFNKSLADALYEGDDSQAGESKIHPNFFDVIFTNPPFGVVLDSTVQDVGKFKTCRNGQGAVLKKQVSEVVFIEQSLRLLKPGATLAIVLPKSIITNSGLRFARSALDNLGYVYAVVVLPPETFSVTGTQTTTAVLFIKKHHPTDDQSETIRVRFAAVSNVGYDSTGRAIEGEQLSTLPSELRQSFDKGKGVGICKLLPEIPKGQTFSALPNLISGRSKSTGGRKLGDVIKLARNGKTPPRASYTKEGLFLVKVGNLTGAGINWVPRERNFVNHAEERKRTALNNGLILQEGDVLLTSSAHSPVYIAKKVDIITRVPDWIGRVASYVGEVMLLRPNTDLINPFILLAYLRSQKAVEEIQNMVRGQTAHLHPEDVLELHLPTSLFEQSKTNELIIKNLQNESRLNDELNSVIYEQQKLILEF